jgi:hypothetical protein
MKRFVRTPSASMAVALIRSGAAIAGPCRTGMSQANCAAIESDANDGSHIEVNTSDTANSPSDRPFYLMVY